MSKLTLLVPMASIVCLLSSTSYADDITFFGEMNNSIVNSNTAYGTRNDKSGTSIENWAAIGIKGSEGITNDVSIIYKMSFQVYNASTDGSSTPIEAYNTYLGLGSNQFGTVLVGRNNTVFKSSEGNIDLFNGSNADINNLVAGQTRSADGIWYYSPKLADLITLNATYLMAANQSTDNTVDINSQYALSATLGDKHFNDQKYYLSASYNNGISSVNAYRGVSQFKLGQFTVGGLYQYTKSLTITESDMKGYSYFLNLMYSFDNINLKAEYGSDNSGLGYYFKNATGGSGTDRSTFSNVKMSQITLGADYILSNSTTLYTHYSLYKGSYNLSNTQVSLSNDNIMTVGVDYHF
ncbi:porin [Shewanella surugensis]|uniref:Porin n=1 Tax=Shewanella surugensis TaxID=212020 RepID=A0ABT0LB43_9GAMM|nr:porin [Shewanella surugensis]MCL1124572.1 porin [Shewanella surugensis]